VKLLFITRSTERGHGGAAGEMLDEPLEILLTAWSGELVTIAAPTS
jgi:hypothetical protein